MVKINGRKYDKLAVRRAADDVGDGVRDGLLGLKAEGEENGLYLWGRANARRLLEGRWILWIPDNVAEEAIRKVGDRESVVRQDAVDKGGSLDTL